MNSRVYLEVTDQITNALIRGVVPWRKPWSGGNAMPTNARSKEPYRGVNVFLLSRSPYIDHRWVTSQRAKELGGTVKRGERVRPVVFWKPWQVEGVDQETGEVLKWNVPGLKQYHVFIVEQCENLDILPLMRSESKAHTRSERADEILRAVPDPPRFQEQGTSAWYRPSEDLVQVPPIVSFDSADAPWCLPHP